MVMRTTYRTAVALVSAAFLGACTTSSDQPVASADDALDMLVFDCGYSDGSFAWLSDEGRFDGESGRLANPCFLIRHPDGTLLWDAGLPGDLADTGPEESDIATLGVDRRLSDQLAELGIAASDIDYLALSHLHIDHAGQPEAATGAVWLAQVEDARAVALGDAGEHAADITALQDFETQSFAGERDVFGDGRVRIIHAPGHTPGHSVLFVDLPVSGPVILSGDLWHRAASREGRTVPAYNSSPERTRISMDRVEALAEATGARIIIQHEVSDYETLPKAPIPMR